MPDLASGQVIAYPYLWAWQAVRGETEGRKKRPVCVALSVRRPDSDMTHLLLLAITTQAPGPDRIALEVPDIERRRAGLDDLKRCWIVLDEYIYDIAERSWYLEPDVAPLGRFSKSFMMQVATGLKGAMPNRALRVDRTE